MGGENAKKRIFPKTHLYRVLNTMEKNRLEKVRKHVFYKHTNIVTKKCGEKTREKMFLETHEYREKKRWKKILWKKCEIRFLLTNEYRVQKIVGKKRVKKIFQKHTNRVSNKF